MMYDVYVSVVDKPVVEYSGVCESLHFSSGTRIS